MTNTTIKTAILALIIVSATLMSGCLTDADTAKEDATIEHMVQLESILTDPEFSEDNAEMMSKAATEIEAITGETYELKAEVNVTPTATPTVTPTAIATPEPKTELPKYYLQKIDMIVDKTQWDDSTIALVCARIPYEGIENVKIYVDGNIVATIEPIDTSNNRVTRSEFDYPMNINLPNGVSNTGEVTMTISVSDLSLGVKDGEYPISVQVRTPPMNLEEKYNEHPVWNP